MNTQNGCDSRNLLSIWRIILDFFFPSYCVGTFFIAAFFIRSAVENGKYKLCEIDDDTLAEMLFLSHKFYWICAILIGHWRMVFFCIPFDYRIFYGNLLCSFTSRSSILNFDLKELK